MTGQVSTAIKPVVGSMSSVIVPSNRPSSPVRNSDRGDLFGDGLGNGSTIVGGNT
jgi:hypothetical protein